MKSIPREVHDDLRNESRKHGHRPPQPRYKIDKVATRDLVEYEAAVIGKKVHHQPQPVRLRKNRHAEGLAE
jgi:hypothetical protein